MKTEIKYAPNNLHDIIYPSDAVKNRILAYGNGALNGHIILHGPNGTGKTSVAKLLPYAIDGENANIETKSFDELLNRKDIDDYISNACISNRFYQSSNFYMVFNEFDNCKEDNLYRFWNAADKHDDLMLVITTNNIMDLHPSIRSRCKIVEMSAVTVNRLLPRAMQILNAEGVNLPAVQVEQLLLEYEQLGDIRVYCRCLDDIIYAYHAGTLKPNNNIKPALKVVKKSK